MAINAIGSCYCKCVVSCWQFLIELITLVILMKYNTPESQSDLLPNLLHLTTVEEIGFAEFEGF